MSRLPGPAAVLDYWFGTLTDGVASAARRRRWFKASAEDDAEIARRFGPLIDRARVGALDHWLRRAEWRLAYILVCDQFPRQAFRGTAQAFATDARARDAAADGVEHGHDLALGPDQRAFFYMPFEHAESRLDQHVSVGLFTALQDAASPGYRQQAASFLAYAREHRDVVQRFGRFPHRNAVLGRRSTAAERAYLKTASGYGQTAR
ncbi:MAG: DUF924 family protein [Pseudomonadales bacterium]